MLGKVGIMTRIAIILFATVAAAVCFDTSPSQAGTYGDAPWCAVQYLGYGDQEWDCEYATAAECAPTVIAGNRGFCNRNPYFVEATPPAYPPPGRHHRVRPSVGQ
jgi:Protein of unknown function (DUF3551)